MKKYLIILTVFFALTACSNKSADNNSKADSVSKEISEEEIYSLLNEIICNDSIRIEPIDYRFDTLYDRIQETMMDKEFTKDDKIANDKQRKRLNKLQIRPNSLKSYQPETKNFSYATIIDSTIRNRDLMTVFYLSFPIISIDKQKIFIRIEENCGICSTGSSTKWYLYQKKNNKWNRIKTF